MVRQDPEARQARAVRRAAWMARAQRGDGEAYRAFLDDIGPAILSFLRRRIADAPDVEDAYQDTFLALHRARHTYQTSRPVEPWIFAIAANVATDHARRRRRRRAREVLGETAVEQPVELERDMDTWLDEVVSKLPSKQREAFELLQREGLTVAEAAARTGTSPGALKVRAHRAYVALKAALRR